MKLPETYLIEVFRPEAKHILELLTKTKDAQENKELQSYYNELAQWGTEHLQKAGEIVLDKIKLSYKDEVIKLGLPRRTNDLWGMINKLIDLMKKHSLNEENVKIIQQTTLEILAGLSKMPIPKAPEDPKDDEEDEDDNHPKPDPNPDPDTKSGKSRDWTAYRAEKLAKVKPTSKALDEFYDEYYSQEYAGVESPEKDTKGIIAKLKSLDKILIPEFNKLGYNIEVNPFASFLKILIKIREKSDIFDKLTYNTYGAIHNSFVEKYITGNMLGQKFDEKNILFCNDLYNKNGLDIVEYLHLQHQVNVAKNNSERADDTDLVAKIFIKQDIPQEQEGAESSYSAKIKLLDNLKDGIIQPGNEKAKLKSLLEIRELYRYIFGKEAETAANKKQVTSQIADDIVNKAERQQITLDMIDYILDQATYTTSDKYFKEARKFEAWFSKLNHHSSRKNKSDCRAILSKYDLTAYAFSLIINNLINRVTERSRNKT